MDEEVAANTAYSFPISDLGGIVTSFAYPGAFREEAALRRIPSER